jgi:hypothetical protein
MADEEEQQDEKSATDKAQDTTNEDGEVDQKARAQQVQENWDKAEDRMREFEEMDDPPSDLSEWPDDEGKYVTYGGGEGDHGYDEGPETKLGPSNLERFEDGSVEVDGEKVDNPDDYKSGDPITEIKE